jgi:Nif-specific regulatory protein
VDGEVIGALSADRPFAVEATLDKDLRLLLIVASTVSQVLKINRLVRVEKEEILARDRRLTRELRERYRLGNVIGESEAIRNCLSLAATAANSRASVLIAGETGTGKELIAGVVHYNSPRAEGPFVKVNCGALPETLLESELFGHVRGAFTGAVRDRKGRFELADGGTLFLDEVAEMSPRLQVKLLRVLQERELEPVGSARTLRVDVRVVAATSCDLREEMQQGRFREDLYYRLNVIPIRLPPLRERREDIPLLVDHFLEKFNREDDRRVTKLSRGVLERLLEYDWPGNVRELENVVERAVVMAPHESFSGELLPEEISSPTPGRRASSRAGRAPGVSRIKRVVDAFLEDSADLAEARTGLSRIVEELVMRHALKDKAASQRELAKRLGMSRVTLRRKLKEYGLG